MDAVLHPSRWEDVGTAEARTSGSAICTRQRQPSQVKIGVDRAILQVRSSLI